MTDETNRLPFSPAVVAAIKSDYARYCRLMLSFGGGVALFALTLALLRSARGLATAQGWAIFCCGLACLAAIVAIPIAIAGALVWRDLRGGVYLRSVGPVRKMPGFHVVEVAGKAFQVRSRWATGALQRMRYGTVDYTPNAHIILAAWNEEGAQVYCAPGYTFGL
jgi:hypothetical protein